MKINMSVDAHVRGPNNMFGLPATPYEASRLADGPTWTIKFAGGDLCLYFESAQALADFANDVLNAATMAMLDEEEANVAITVPSPGLDLDLANHPRYKDAT